MTEQELESDEIMTTEQVAARNRGVQNLRDALGMPSQKARFVSNIDTKTRAGAAVVMRCADQPTLKTEDILGVTLSIQNFLIHTIDLQEATGGEIIRAARTVLVTSDGETLAFVSDGIVDSLELLIQAVGRGPWVPPLRVAVKVNKTRRGFRTYKLSLVD